MKTLVDLAREAFLIFEPDLRVVSANPMFYEMFQVTQKQTERLHVYDLGNGQWNIPELKKLLEQILPKKKTVKDYMVTHKPMHYLIKSDWKLHDVVKKIEEILETQGTV